MASLALEFDTKSTISIESHLERLAIEANVLSNLLDTFRNIIPSLTSKIKDTASLITDVVFEDKLGKDVKECKHIHSKLLPKFKHVSYANYDKLLIATPEGFKGKFLDYVELLNKLLPDVYSSANNILAEYNFILSSFISNKDEKTAIKDHRLFFNKVSEKQKEYIKSMNEFFPEGNDKTRSYLGNVVDRFADLDDIVNALVKLDRQHNKQNIKDIINSTNNCITLLDIIINNVETKGIDKVSGNAAMNIAEGAYAVAKYVEFISVFRFRTEQAITSIKNTFEIVDAAIK